MVVLLKKLTYGAMLSPSEASEEFREGILLCVKALLLSLYSCSDVSCLCEQIPGLPALSDDIYNDELHKTFKYGSESDKCLLAFLQSQFASAAVGHWLSLLLKVCWYFFCWVSWRNFNSVMFFFFFWGCWLGVGG